MSWFDAVTNLLIFLDVWLGCGLLAAGLIFAECKRDRFLRNEHELRFWLYMGLAIAPLMVIAAGTVINPFGRYGWSLRVV